MCLWVMEGTTQWVFVETGLQVIFLSDIEGHPEQKGKTTAKIPTSGIQPAHKKTGAIKQQDGTQRVTTQLIHTNINTPTH